MQSLTFAMCSGDVFLGQLGCQNPPAYLHIPLWLMDTLKPLLQLLATKVNHHRPTVKTLTWKKSHCCAVVAHCCHIVGQFLNLFSWTTSHPTPKSTQTSLPVQPASALCMALLFKLSFEQWLSVVQDNPGRAIKGHGALLNPQA